MNDALSVFCRVGCWFETLCTSFDELVRFLEKVLCDDGW